MIKDYARTIWAIFYIVVVLEATFIIVTTSNLFFGLSVGDSISLVLSVVSISLAILALWIARESDTKIEKAVNIAEEANERMTSIADFHIHGLKVRFWDRDRALKLFNKLDNARRNTASWRSLEIFNQVDALKKWASPPVKRTMAIELIKFLSWLRKDATDGNLELYNVELCNYAKMTQVAYFQLLEDSKDKEKLIKSLEKLVQEGKEEDETVEEYLDRLVEEYKRDNERPTNTSSADKSLISFSSVNGDVTPGAHGRYGDFNMEDLIPGEGNELKPFSENQE